MWKLITVIVLVLSSLTVPSLADAVEYNASKDLWARVGLQNAFALSNNLTWLAPRLIPGEFTKGAMGFTIDPYQPITEINITMVTERACNWHNAGLSGFKHTYNKTWQDVNYSIESADGFFLNYTNFPVNSSDRNLTPTVFIGSTPFATMWSIPTGTRAGFTVTRMDDSDSNFTGATNDLFLYDLYANGTSSFTSFDATCTQTASDDFGRKYSVNSDFAPRIVIDQKPTTLNNISSRGALRYILYDYETNRTTFSSNDSLILNLDQLDNNEWIYDTRNNFFGLRSDLIMSDPIQFSIPQKDLEANQINCNNVSYTTTGVIGDLTPIGEPLGSFGTGVCINLTAQHSSRLNQTIELPNDKSANGIFNMTGNVGLYHLNRTGVNDPTTSFIDSSDSGNIGTCVSDACPEPVQGFFGGVARHFDGDNDKIDIPNSPSLNSTNEELTISVWFRSENNTNQKPIFSQNVPEKYLYLPGNQVRFRAELDNLTIIILNSGSGTVVENQLYHVVVTFNGTRLALYLDGEEMDSAILSTETTLNTLIDNTWSIGSCQGNWCQGNFTGMIDEVAIWNRSISESEVAQLYNFATQRIVEVNRPFYGTFFLRNQSCPNILGCEGGIGQNDGFDTDVDLGFMGTFLDFIVSFNSFSPIEPQARESIYINFVSTRESNGSLRYRSRPIDNESQSSFSTFTTIQGQNITTIHSIAIDNLQGERFYQFEVIGTLSDGTVARDNNTGLYYNFTVSTKQIFDGNDTAVLPIALENLSNTGFCSFDVCTYIFGIFVLLMATGFAWKIGGNDLGIAVAITMLVTESLIGFLPRFLFVPFLIVSALIVSNYIVNKVKGGGNV